MNMKADALWRQGDNWNDLLKEVVTFDSVEEFWGIYVRGESSYDWDDPSRISGLTMFSTRNRTTSHLHPSLH